MHPEGGIPPPAAPDGVRRATIGERPPEEEEEIVRRLGFDVERRELSKGMECIEVCAEGKGGVLMRVLPHLLYIISTIFWFVY